MVILKRAEGLWRPVCTTTAKHCDTLCISVYLSLSHIRSARKMPSQQCTQNPLFRRWGTERDWLHIWCLEHLATNQCHRSWKLLSLTLDLAITVVVLERSIAANVFPSFQTKPRKTQWIPWHSGEQMRSTPHALKTKQTKRSSLVSIWIWTNKLRAQSHLRHATSKVNRTVCFKTTQNANQSGPWSLSTDVHSKKNIAKKIKPKHTTPQSAVKRHHEFILQNICTKTGKKSSGVRAICLTWHVVACWQISQNKQTHNHQAATNTVPPHLARQTALASGSGGYWRRLLHSGRTPRMLYTSYTINSYKRQKYSK